MIEWANELFYLPRQPSGFCKMPIVAIIWPIKWEASLNLGIECNTSEDFWRKFWKFSPKEFGLSKLLYYSYVKWVCRNRLKFWCVKPNGTMWIHIVTCSLLSLFSSLEISISPESFDMPGTSHYADNVTIYFSVAKQSQFFYSSTCYHWFYKRKFHNEQTNHK